jgi:hypothetical protein
MAFVVSLAMRNARLAVHLHINEEEMERDDRVILALKILLFVLFAVIGVLKPIQNSLRLQVAIMLALPLFVLTMLIQGWRCIWQA